MVLTNEQVADLLSPADAFGALEQAYRDLGSGRAVNRPRSWAHVSQSEPDSVYQLVTMDGGSGPGGYFGTRLLSHVLSRRRVMGPGRARSGDGQGGRFSGLIIAFDVEDGQPLVIVPQDAISTLRLAATSALAAQYLARPDSRVLGVLGSGRHATGHAIALAQRYKLSEIRVFSPNPEHRRRFGDRVTELTGVPVAPAATAQEVADCDILVAATNASAPVFEAQWIKSGTCAISINLHEYPSDMATRAHIVVVKGKQAGLKFAAPEVIDIPQMREIPEDAWNRWPDLADLVAGAVSGRTDSDEIAFFLNNEGLGMEFVALAARAYKNAVERGVGHRVPREWFLA